MTKLLDPADDDYFNPAPVFLDGVEFEAIHAHLNKIHEILEHIYARHTADLSGVALAAKASAEADIRAADHDVDQAQKYLGRR